MPPPQRRITHSPFGNMWVRLITVYNYLHENLTCNLKKQWAVACFVRPLCCVGCLAALSYEAAWRWHCVGTITVAISHYQQAPLAHTVMFCGKKEIYFWGWFRDDSRGYNLQAHWNHEWCFGPDNALVRLYWARDHLGQWDQFCYKSGAGSIAGPVDQQSRHTEKWATGHWFLHILLLVCWCCWWCTYPGLISVHSYTFQCLISRCGEPGDHIMIIYQYVQDTSQPAYNIAMYHRLPCYHCRQYYYISTCKKWMVF